MNEIRVLYKHPGCAPEIRYLPNTLEALQEAVGGKIETLTFAPNSVIVCNEEGRLLGMGYNCEFAGVDLVGPIVIAGVDGEEFTDLKLKDAFWLQRQLKDDWLDATEFRPLEGDKVLVMASGQPGENITMVDAYILASWSSSDGWICETWPEWEDAEVRYWRYLPPPPLGR